MKTLNTSAALKTAILAAKTILGVSIDPLKTDLITVVTLLNKEKSLYHGMQKFQSEKGDFEKAEKYDCKAWALRKVCNKLNPLVS